MKTVKLKKEMLIEDTVQPEGAVVSLPDARANQLISAGHAEASDAAVSKTDPKINPLTEVIQPVPPDGVLASPLDGTLPRVEDNPGLQVLETAATTGGPRRATRITGKAD